MEVLFFILLIIYLIAKGSQSAGKQQKNRNPQKAPQPKDSRKVPAKPEPSPVKEPAAAEAEQRVLPEEPRERARVSVKVSAHHHEDMYVGSMNAAETQGNPDAYDQMPSEHSAELFVENEEEQPEETEGLKLDFTGSSLVNAVIMQEVLKRPDFRRS